MDERSAGSFAVFAKGDMAVFVPEAKPGKGRRVATAIGFLSGVLACLGALRDAKVVWPPGALWAALSHPQRLQLGAGIALMVVSFIISVARRSEAQAGSGWPPRK